MVTWATLRAIRSRGRDRTADHPGLIAGVAEREPAGARGHSEGARVPLRAVHRSKTQWRLRGGGELQGSSGTWDGRKRNGEASLVVNVRDSAQEFRVHLRRRASVAEAVSVGEQWIEAGVVLV